MSSGKTERVTAQKMSASHGEKEFNIITSPLNTLYQVRVSVKEGEAPGFRPLHGWPFLQETGQIGNDYAVISADSESVMLMQ